MIDQERMNLIIKVTDRGYPEMKKYYRDLLSMFMDIDFADKDCPMDFQKLLDFDDINFYHDITGIYKNINRGTKKLDNCFVPRCAK